jgi:hypothetical protein
MVFLNPIQNIMYKLTRKYQISKKGKDGKNRNYILYFLNNILILKQKAPFNEDREYGYDGCCIVENEYVLNGKLYQTRFSDSDQSMLNGFYQKTNPRNVSYPLSKNIMAQFAIPKDLKIEIEPYLLYKNKEA